MSVSIRHADVAGHSVAVIGGLDTPAAVSHLCHSLASGGGVDDEIVVIDLTEAAGLAAQAQDDLDRAADAMRHAHRWLGVADAGSVASGVSTSSLRIVFRTAAAATAAGRRYLDVMSGQRGAAHAQAVVSGVCGLAASAAELLRGGLVWTAGDLRRWGLRGAGR